MSHPDISSFKLHQFRNTGNIYRHGCGFPLCIYWSNHCALIQCHQHLNNYSVWFTLSTLASSTWPVSKGSFRAIQVIGHESIRNTIESIMTRPNSSHPPAPPTCIWCHTCQLKTTPAVEWTLVCVSSTIYLKTFFRVNWKAVLIVSNGLYIWVARVPQRCHIFIYRIIVSVRHQLYWLRTVAF